MHDEHISYIFIFIQVAVQCTDLGNDSSIGSGERSCPRSTSRSGRHRVRTPVTLACSHRVNTILGQKVLLVWRKHVIISTTS